MEVVAVDWSGARDPAGQRRHLWMATARDGALTDLSGGRTRAEVVQALIERRGEVGTLVVGLDFAFGFPAWFTRELGLSSAPALWAHVGERGEHWLQTCESPFWGRPGVRRPELPDHFRQTDLDNAPAKSVFQIGGAGAVGTGSIRGMPYLQVLREAGFAIWPFDAPTRSLVVEIYPRALTGPVTKKRIEDRTRYLGSAPMARRLRARARSSEDAFDAAISALAMDRAAEGFARLGRAEDPVELLEGAIWVPGRLRAGPQALVTDAAGTSGAP